MPWGAAAVECESLWYLIEAKIDARPVSEKHRDAASFKRKGVGSPAPTWWTVPHRLSFRYLVFKETEPLLKYFSPE